ncbi:MAG: creatininase family protein [Gemmatimonadaceae bacterium]
MLRLSSQTLRRSRDLIRHSGERRFAETVAFRRPVPLETGELVLRASPQDDHEGERRDAGNGPPALCAFEAGDERTRDCRGGGCQDQILYRRRAQPAARGEQREGSRDDPNRSPMSQPLSAPRPNRIKEMRPDEIAAVLAVDQRLIIPVGTCEQHGPHMPLGCDTIIVEHLADGLSAEFGVLRAPTLEYGVNVVTEIGFAGNGSLRRKTLHRALNDLVDTWEATGIREFILLTAHEHDPHLEALATLITSGARVRVVDTFGMNLSDLLEGQTEPMHGDEVDTSLILYLAPELVRMDLAQDYMMSRDELRRYRRGWLRIPKVSPGSIGRPTLASAEKGRMLYERIYQRIRERVFLTTVAAEA